MRVSQSLPEEFTVRRWDDPVAALRACVIEDIGSSRSKSAGLAAQAPRGAHKRSLSLTRRLEPSLVGLLWLAIARAAIDRRYRVSPGGSDHCSP
jgi:hypothetical protein